MTIQFSTLFDHRYLHHGLALIRSMERHCRPFRVDVLALTLECEHALRKRIASKELSEDEVNVISLVDFIRESPYPLEEIRQQRSPKSFVWTLEPLSVEACYKRNPGSDVIFIDADLMFFSDPCDLVFELNADICLTPHWFPHGKEYMAETVGQYNLGFAWFRGNSCAVERHLADWSQRAVASCSDATGMQRELDNWRNDDLVNVRSFPPEVNCGPWSLPEIRLVDGVATMKDGSPLVAYHFHEFREGKGRNPCTIKGRQFNMTNYEIHPSTMESVYLPYVKELEAVL